MTKKRKTDAKSLPKGHQHKPLFGSLDTELCDLQRSCSHYTYEGTAHLKKFLRDILHSKCARKCKFCLNDGKDQQPSSKNKKGRRAAKAQNDVVEIHVWVCLTCNEHFCAAVDLKARSHARLHAKETQHWWPAKSSDPSSVYCFKCNREGHVMVKLLFDKPKTARQDLRFRIQGLQSLGSDSCFNALLQNILSLKVLRNEMLLHLEFPRAAPLSIALRELFVRTSWTNAGGPLDQRNLLSQICSLYPDFRSSYMLDSEQSFHYLLDGLRTEEKKAWVGVPTVANSTIFDSVFGGQCSINVSCNKCSGIVEDEDFIYLSLPVPSERASGAIPLVNTNTQASAGIDDGVYERNNPVSLENCLKLYTDAVPWICQTCNNTKGPKIEEQVIDGCKKGEDNRDKLEDDKRMVFDASSRRVLIRIPPTILTLHLKRSSEDCRGQSKSLKGCVQYNENLDIGPFMDPRSRVDGNYRLVGAVLHNETLTGGCYIANVKANVATWQGSSSTWFTVMDEQVKKLAFGSFEGEAHLLFYQKVQGNLGKEDTKAIVEADNDKEGWAEEKEMLCKGAEPDPVETHPELKVKAPLPLALEMVEGSQTHGNVIRALPNLGNSCFFNAMVQILLALDPLRCKMLQPDVWRGYLSSPLKQLFLDTNALNPPRGSLEAQDLFEHTCTICTGFKIGAQEDCHQALCGFLDALRMEEAAVQNPPDNVLIDELPTAVNSVFGGSLVSTITGVNCNHSSTKIESFLGIELGIPSGSFSSIEDCWALYTEQTGVPDGWECSYCASEQVEHVEKDPKSKVIPVKRNGMQKILIGRTPQVLVVNLKRYKHSGTSGSQKWKVNVRFNEMFNMQPFMKERSEENTMYKLVGVVVHMGDMGQGHYVAYVRANEMASQMNHRGSDHKSWFFVSDEQIRKSSLDEVLGCEAYILIYEKCANMEPCSSIMPTVEESQVADGDMQPQTSAAANDLSPSPLDNVQPWEYQKTHNKYRDEKNKTLMENYMLGQQVRVFLELFTLPGDKMLFYPCELAMMCERGSGSRELNIHYSHLLRFSKELAMNVCNRYESLTVSLKEAAINFAQKLLDSDLKLEDTDRKKLTDTGRKRMMQLASTSMEPDASLELKFLQMPNVHQLLSHCLQPPLTENMNVYGCKKQIRTPLPEKCALVQKFLAHMLDNHRNGLSWEGEFDPEDVDVYDDRVFIAKEPKPFPIHPISPLMVRAMGKDFNRTAESVLKKFLCDDAIVPYLRTFIKMLSEMGSYDSWWSDAALAEALRELIENFPFLKPSMARSNLWSGIFSANKSHDAGDMTAPFKTVLGGTTGIMNIRGRREKWLGNSWFMTNGMLKCVFKHKDPKPEPSTEPAAQPAAEPASEPAEETEEPAEETETEPAEETETEPAEGTEGEPAAEPGEPAAEIGYYEGDYTFLMEYLRHLFHHGSGYSFKFMPPKKRGSRPRIQLMKSLNETELAAAIDVEEFTVDALLELLKHSAMTGLLVDVWECYKNCNYPYRQQRPNH